jgi:hypothetical protein
VGYVEDAFESRTKLGKGRVLGRQGLGDVITPFSASC